MSAARQRAGSGGDVGQVEVGGPQAEVALRDLGVVADVDRQPTPLEVVAQRGGRIVFEQRDGTEVGQPSGLLVAVAELAGDRDRRLVVRAGGGDVALVGGQAPEVPERGGLLGPISSSRATASASVRQTDASS